MRVILGHDAHHPLDFIREKEIDIVNEILKDIPLKQELNMIIK